MRRKTAKTLADLGRTTGLAGCLLAGATAYVWGWHPKTVGDLEQRLEQRLTRTVRERWSHAQQERDPARQRDLLLGLLADLEHVRGQDRLAEVVSDCHGRLAALAESRGDFAEAALWMEASVAFDPRDVVAQARLGELLCRRPETLSRGLDLLKALTSRFPGQPHVVRAHAAALVNAGRAAEALAVLEAAHAAPQSNLWYVFWDAGQAPEVHFARPIPVVHDGTLRLRFDLADQCRGLQFVLPRFGSFTLLQPRLHVVVGEHRRVVDLSSPEVKLHQVLRGEDRLDAIGHYDATIDVGLPDLPTGTIECTLVGIPRERRSSLFATPAATAAMARFRDECLQRRDVETARRVREWRRAACAGLPMEVFHHDETSEFGRERRVEAVIRCVPGEDAFDAVFEVQQRVTELRVDLPPGRPGLHYELVGIDVMVDDVVTTWDPRTMPLTATVDCERRDGAFVATGNDPYFVFPAPSGGRLVGLRVRGTL